MRVIGTVGMPGCGKSEAAEVAKEMGIPVVTMGDVVRKEAERRGLEPTDENFGKVGKSLREEEGMDAIARRCTDLIKEHEAETVLVDGIRGGSEVNLFKEEFGDDFLLVSIEVPFETRFERVSDRGRSDDFTTREELRKRDQREIGYGLDEAMKKSDITIENTGSLEDFRSRIRSILEPDT